MHKVLWVVLFLIVVVLLISAFTARVYHGQGAVGVAWDWGGIEIIGDPGFFICPGVYDFNSHTMWVNPLSKLLPNLVTDC